MNVTVFTMFNPLTMQDNCILVLLFLLRYNYPSVLTVMLFTNKHLTDTFQSERCFEVLFSVILRN